MRLLILGGTQFLGRAIAAHACAMGHDVTCAARGVAGSVPHRARFIRVDRDEPDGLAPLADEEFDALYSDDLFRRGYTVAHFGQGRWNGVALLSRVGLDDVVTGLPDAAGPLAGEARAIGATCGELRVCMRRTNSGRLSTTVAQRSSSA